MTDLDGIAKIVLETSAAEQTLIIWYLFGLWYKTGVFPDI